MSARPTVFNAAIAWLFIIGSACFVIGSVPAYLNAVGGVADGVTFVIGSIFLPPRPLASCSRRRRPR